MTDLDPRLEQEPDTSAQQYDQGINDLELPRENTASVVGGLRSDPDEGGEYHRP